MNNVQLKLVHNDGGRTGTPRLCDSCLHGLVLRGEGMEFAWCGYMHEYVAVCVESCSKHAGTGERRAEDGTLQLLSRYTLD